ncbi:phospholipid/cholesterol/gamma-HCH transport system substrate-binding protein [Mycolicibacterium sp. BK634]|uniref:MCE family protein n=1 Tax=Mycolicibacterium sp. BK634 TaxID=2587099 RepID=UPI00161BD8F5|nr:MCE family protein [Mycolicibacterium sp. BK634]MBB3748126.1 phospholipid/cholesterol/gamma-HCH transport system substrate-binding protein [Mycolicibacterium sp. BK634]
MKSRSRIQLGLALVLAVVLVVGVIVGLRAADAITKTRVTAYFDNSTGIYPGDQIRILGVPVGEIETIEPQPHRAKITFWVDDQYKIPADVKAVILSPSLVTARAIQLAPAYTSGPVLADHAVIPQDRTAVPVEWDDLRMQLQKLTQTLQPTEPGGVSSLGAFVNTVADNLRGQGANIHDMVVKLSQALSILGDHSGDIFGTIKNLAVLVSALHDSADLMRELNQNLAAVTASLANDPDEVGRAVTDLNTAITDVHGFVTENRAALGTTSEKISEIAAALGDSIDDVKQALHILPSTLANYVNIYQPAQGSVTGVLAGTNFSNPINFICGAIQAASRLNAEQSAKLCVQYLAPIVKNRQYNYLMPFGFNMVGTQARPNEVTYSEDWMRPDYVPPADVPPPAAVDPAPPPLPAESPDAGPPSPASADPSAGLAGLLIPSGSPK